MEQKKGWHIVFNAPVTLGFVLICVAVQVVSAITGGASNRLLFSVYRSSFADPLAYLRVFTHVLGHSGWEHLLNNMMYLLILGPMLEERYGGKSLLVVIAATALVIGLVSLIFSPNVLLMGASGVVFAFILLASITSAGNHGIPLTFLLVAVLYIGQQIYEGITQPDHISQLAHIVGGLVGSGFGFVMNRKKIG